MNRASETAYRSEPTPTAASEVTEDLHAYLLEVWSAVFAEFRPGGIPASLGIDDDFFALGGTSLLAMMVLSRVYDELQVELHFRLLLEGPTIRQLAGHLSAALAADGTSP